MAEVIVFEDVEALVITYLKGLFSCTVATEVPKTRPDQFIKVTATGGRKIRLNAEQVSITIQCWANTTTAASDLAKLARAYMNAVDQLGAVWVYRVQESARPQYFPDPETNTPVYQFTVVLDIKGGVLS